MSPAPDIAEPALSGLTQHEAAERLRTEGYNELPGTRRRSLGIIALEVLREPMFGLLIAAGGIYLVFGDIHEALILLSFVLVVMAVSVYQQRRTERVLEALRDLTSPRALVLRDGVEQRIAGREVVRDDLLLLTEGDRVAADAVLLSCNDLAADESVLTGESMSVNKIPWDGAMPMTRPGGDGLPFVYAGSVLVQGQGMARVTATGGRSEIGRIGRALGQVTPSVSPLQRETVRLVRVLALIGVALALLVIALYGFTRHDWLGALLAGITLDRLMGQFDQTLGMYQREAYLDALNTQAVFREGQKLHCPRRNRCGHARGRRRQGHRVAEPGVCRRRLCQCGARRSGILPDPAGADQAQRHVQD